MSGDRARLPRLAVPVGAGVPILGITGINGAGKTLLAAQQAIWEMSTGRVVYSTVPIVSPWGSTRPIRSLRELLELRNCTLVLDDVSVIFSSRASSSLPNDIITLLHTLRHSLVTVIWTAPEWGRAAIDLRIATQALVNVIPMARRHDGSPWPSPRLVLAGLMDTSIGKVDETPTKVLKRRIYFPRKLQSWGSYDTLADTPLIGRHLAGGTCVDCGGTMERPKHSESRHTLLGLPYYATEFSTQPALPPQEQEANPALVASSS